ncbi:unnamed protein product [Ixodes pacificus]
MVQTSRNHILGRGKLTSKKCATGTVPKLQLAHVTSSILGALQNPETSPGRDARNRSRRSTKCLRRKKGKLRRAGEFQSGHGRRSLRSPADDGAAAWGLRRRCAGADGRVEAGVGHREKYWRKAWGVTGMQTGTTLVGARGPSPSSGVSSSRGTLRQGWPNDCTDRRRRN